MHTSIYQCFDQLTAVKTGYPLTSITWPYRGLRCRPIEVKLSADKLLVCKWSQAQVIFFLKVHMKYVVYFCRTIKILISNWPRTRKFSQLLQAGKTVAFDFAHYDHALVALFVEFLCCDWSKFDRWVIRKIYAASWTVRNIPNFKDRANWSRDTFQPMRRRACVYPHTNQNIALVIKNFHNSRRRRTESNLTEPNCLQFLAIQVVQRMHAMHVQPVAYEHSL